MKITHTDIYKFSIPMDPFTIATGTSYFAQNIFLRIHTDSGIYGVGEGCAVSFITGETQETCYVMAKDFAQLWKDKDPLEIEARLSELNSFTAFNSTIKSAFDMALYDISAKNANLPLYAFLGGTKRTLESDITVGIDAPEVMAEKATEFRKSGAGIIKVKLGKKASDDIERIKQIRQAVGEEMVLRVDANQGWTYDDALKVLRAISEYNIEFCEQPMRRFNDHLMPDMHKHSPIPIMADESVFDHHDAERLIRTKGCRYVNIKFAKSGGIHEALKVNEVCRANQIACMMGGMLESRVALTAFAHFASALPNIRFYDMDTCLIGHKIDPVTGGVKYDKYNLTIPDGIGIGADADDDFLQTCEKITV